MRKTIQHAFTQARQAVEALSSEEAVVFMEQVAKTLIESFQQGGQLLVAGNGGSLCDAMHFAEELTGQFRKPRPALPAIALSDPGFLSCVANDMGYDAVFARGVEAHGRVGDVFVGLTTSGNSPNIIRAVEQAKKQGVKTVLFLGKNGGKLAGVADFEYIVPEQTTSDRIQEVHMLMIHVLIELVEQELFYSQEQVKEPQQHALV